jgi:hypothetical protein
MDHRRFILMDEGYPSPLLTVIHGEIISAKRGTAPQVWLDVSYDALIRGFLHLGHSKPILFFILRGLVMETDECPNSWSRIHSPKARENCTYDGRSD